jgi:energy-converting hydrogenase A subunit M
MAQCYLNMRLFEDAVIYCDKALKIDKDHMKSLFRKAKAFVFMYDFYEAKYYGGLCPEAQKN